MKLSNFLAGACLLSATNAVDMSRYTAGPGVEKAFKIWLRELYIQTEALRANKTFTDFFVVPDGRWMAGPYNAVGARQISELKFMLLPPDSGQKWSHVPNITTVYSETSTQKIYQVNGTINKDFNGYQGVNNCSAQYFQERFTLRKKANGKTDLVPFGHNLIFYNDYGLQPEEAPTNIPCQ